MQNPFSNFQPNWKGGNNVQMPQQPPAQWGNGFQNPITPMTNNTANNFANSTLPNQPNTAFQNMLKQQQQAQHQQNVVGNQQQPPPTQQTPENNQTEVQEEQSDVPFYRKKTFLIAMMVTGIVVLIFIILVIFVLYFRKKLKARAIGQKKPQNPQNQNQSNNNQQPQNNNQFIPTQPIPPQNPSQPQGPPAMARNPTNNTNPSAPQGATGPQATARNQQNPPENPQEAYQRRPIVKTKPQSRVEEIEDDEEENSENEEQKLIVRKKVPVAKRPHSVSTASKLSDPKNKQKKPISLGKKAQVTAQVLEVVKQKIQQENPSTITVKTDEKIGVIHNDDQDMEETPKPSSINNIDNEPESEDIPELIDDEE